MPEYKKDPLKSLAGRVGKDPVRRDTRKGTVVGFSVAVPTGYDDADAPMWFDVSVFNEGLQASVLAEIQKGQQVAIEGFYSTREYEGKLYHQIMANRVGLIEYLARSKRQAPSAPAADPTSIAPAPAAAPVTAASPTVEELKAQLAALQAAQAAGGAPAATHPDDLPF